LVDYSSGIRRRAKPLGPIRLAKPLTALHYRWKEVSGLLLLTVLALLVHGYHPFAEDAEIYLPGVQKILHPELFPVGAEFFQTHAHLTLFPNLIALSVRATHLPFEVVLLLWQLASIFLFLLACWQLSGHCFREAKARWAGVALVAALLTLPVAGTALYIMDQYLNPRNLAAFAAVSAVVGTLEKKYVRGGLWLAFAASMHVFTAFFALSYCALLVMMRRLELRWAGIACWLPFVVAVPLTSEAYHEAAKYHTFHYLGQWAWYEWLGALAPMGLFWWFSRLALANERSELRGMCQAFVIYDFIYFAGALVLSLPKSFENLARFQPLRSLHLLYIVMIVVGGGFLGEHVLKRQPWRWVTFFLLLNAGMFLAQRALFPASAHIEWPGRAPKNPWAQAFVWVRGHTPVNTVFALDPLHMQIAGEDANGFRCIAQRSMLADAVKDSGAVSMFPLLADEWWRQVRAQQGWKNFQPQDFERLRTEFGVSWVVVQQPGVATLDCPYQNRAVRVCRLD